MTRLQDAVVLVTGANGGLGRHFVAQALRRGAGKVYATARTPRPAHDWGDARVVPLALDVTDRASVAAAAEAAGDVSVLVNNAGAWDGEASLLAPDLSAARELFETNFWGPLEVTNAFIPALRRAGGALVNVLSVLSWLGVADTYSASKAALWSATNTQRLALAGSGVQVLGLHLAYTDTAMTAGMDVAKNDPADVVAAAYDGLESGASEVLADDTTRRVKQGLAAPLTTLYRQIA